MSARRARLVLTTIAIGVVASANVALADVAAPPGYVEACTRDNATESGEECVELSRWVFDGRCVKTLVDEGFCARCGKGTTMRSEFYCRKKRATALPRDWATKCLAEPDPKKLDPKDLPRLPPVEQCPTERTKSSIVGEDDSGSDPPKPRGSGGCGCSSGGAEPAELWGLIALGALLGRRRAR